MAQIAVLALGLGAAVFTDVRTRRIPNWLTGAHRRRRRSVSRSAAVR